MPIADPALGILVIIVGVVLIAGGIVVAAVVHREGRAMKNYIMPLLDMMDFEALLPADWGSLIRMGPLLIAAVKYLLLRVFTYIEIAGLLGGAGISVVGVIVFLMGLSIAY